MTTKWLGYEGMDIWVSGSGELGVGEYLRTSELSAAPSQGEGADIVDDLQEDILSQLIRKRIIYLLEVVFN